MEEGVALAVALRSSSRRRGEGVEQKEPQQQTWQPVLLKIVAA